MIPAIWACGLTGVLESDFANFGGVLVVSVSGVGASFGCFRLLRGYLLVKLFNTYYRLDVHKNNFLFEINYLKGAARNRAMFWEV